jgi:hypothetical protein
MACALDLDDVAVGSRGIEPLPVGIDDLVRAPATSAQLGFTLPGRIGDRGSEHAEVGGRGVGLAALNRGNWLGDPIPPRTTGSEADFGDPALTGPQDRIDRPASRVPLPLLYN